MQRRQFCKSLAIAAASTALPSYGRSSLLLQTDLPPGFNQYQQDYAAFCALPPEKRVFYKVSDGKIVRRNSTNPTGSSRLGTTIPVRCKWRAAHGMTYQWRRQSRISQAMVRSNPPGIRCSSTKHRIGTRMPSSAFGLIGARSAWPRPETGTHAISTSRGSGSTNITSIITGRHRASDTRSSARNGRCSTGTRTS